MNIRLRFTVAIATIALIVGVGACSSSGKKTTDTSPAGIANAISIKNFTFTPKDLTVKVGADVTWTNSDGFNHQIAIKDGAIKDPIGQGEQTVLSFPTAGKFDFFCNIHNSMTGTVTVTG